MTGRGKKEKKNKVKKNKVTPGGKMMLQKKSKLNSKYQKVFCVETGENFFPFLTKKIRGDKKNNLI